MPVMSQGTEPKVDSIPIAEHTAVVASLQRDIDELKRQVAWFKQQVFGSKSERLRTVDNPSQMVLGEVLTGESEAAPDKTRSVAAHTRKAAARDVAVGDDEGPLFFDPDKVPVQTIEVPNPAAEGLRPDQYTVIDSKVSHRLAQRPGSYVVLKYVRPVIKVKGADAPTCPAAPLGVIEGSRADVSFLAGVLIDKFVWHLPLYRQHQRSEQAGFRLSRPWFTQVSQRTISLLTPIYEAQLASVLASHVLTMDETAIKAGHQDGKMKATYYWPLYGDQHEVCFPWFGSREHKHVQEAIGIRPPGSILLSDGYQAYASYAARTDTTHAQCWVHTRREFYEAQDAEPQRARAALEMIGKLYKIEADIAKESLTGDAKRQYRLEHSLPIVETFFRWIDEQFCDQGLLPSSPFTKALAYARERRTGLEHFLRDPDLPLDTNHLERALRVIPMGRKNWNFCWTEYGAKQVGIIQSLLTTCRLHQVDPYTWLVDVLQRISHHPASRVSELTPRHWSQHFGSSPMRSAVDGYHG